VRVNLFVLVPEGRPAAGSPTPAPGTPGPPDRGIYRGVPRRGRNPTRTTVSLSPRRGTARGPVPPSTHREQG